MQGDRLAKLAGLAALAISHTPEAIFRACSDVSFHGGFDGGKIHTPPRKPAWMLDSVRTQSPPEFQPKSLIYKDFLKFKTRFLNLSIFLSTSESEIA